jgi:hypothetical protein
MAGVKGKSGGPRPNSGGARPGAGRKPKAKPAESANVPAPPPAGEPPVDITKLNMLEMLQAVALGKVAASPLQVRAAIAAVQYTHTKRGDGGKKDAADDAAKKAAGAGKFAAAPPPRLAVNNTR